MKIVHLGIAIILLGIAVMLAYSSTGFGYSIGTTYGLTISFLGFFISVVGCFIKDNK